MIDLYCERLDNGLWAEPINAFTNLAFVVAGYVAWRLADQRDSMSPGIGLLIALIVAIGVGSDLFHTFATNWARVLDVLPILLFQLVYLFMYGRQIAKIRLSTLTGLVVLFILAADLARQFPNILNGSLIYLPALVMLFVLGPYHYRHARVEPTLLLWATAVFSVSLFFRTIDLDVCKFFPIGTHFLWHLFNGLLVYLAYRALLLNLGNTPKNIDR